MSKKQKIKVQNAKAAADATSNDQHNHAQQPQDADQARAGQADDTSTGGKGNEQDQADTSASADELESLRQERDNYKDRLQRVAAEYQNYQKRVARDQRDSEAFHRGEVIRQFLNLVDDIKRAVEAVDKAGDVESVAKGVQMLQEQALSTLGKLNVEPIPTVGTSFDPRLHEAILHQPSAEHEPGTVLAEVTGGYTMGERTLRPAKVVVSKAVEEQGPAGESGGDNDQANDDSSGQSVDERA